MHGFETTSCFMVEDDFLNFSLDEEEEDEEKTTTPNTIVKDPSCSSSLESSNPISHDPDDQSRSFPEFEEELEWLSNRDAFPEVETCFGILSDNPAIMFDHQSPVSVLENSSSSSNSSANGNGNSNGSTIMSCCGSFKIPVSYPVRARSKRRRRRRRAGFADLPSQQGLWLNQVNLKSNRQELAVVPSQVVTSNVSIGRKCQHCGAEKTPQWRAGPMGPKTLCNACGVRYKSGRLLPEYRPASSPTFSTVLHSNSHRKVLEMRRQKQLGVGGIMVNEACGYRVG